jgi:folate-dependent phosphoribosylglycinamide formyltransferase PurN
MSKKWIAFFSQTGSEIVDLAKDLGRWPDLIVTNTRPEKLRKINPEILESNLLTTLPNRPSEKDYEDVINYYSNPLITLHGWLRVVPAKVCNKNTIVNGHPGLITKYEHLKGKDPQIRAFEEKLPVMGCVLHRVSAGVDEGKILAEERFNAEGITEEQMWTATRDRSFYLWYNFLKKAL